MSCIIKANLCQLSNFKIVWTENPQPLFWTKVQYLGNTSSVSTKHHCASYLPCSKPGLRQQERIDSCLSTTACTVFILCKLGAKILQIQIFVLLNNTSKPPSSQCQAKRFKFSIEFFHFDSVRTVRSSSLSQVSLRSDLGSLKYLVLLCIHVIPALNEFSASVSMQCFVSGCPGLRNHLCVSLLKDSVAVILKLFEQGLQSCDEWADL